MPEVDSTAKAAKKAKKDKKDKKDKKEKKDKTEGKEKHAKKRERSKSHDGARILSTNTPVVVQKRRSKWDTSETQLAPEPAAVENPALIPERFCSVNEETLPQFTDEELLVRTIILEPIPLDVKAQEVLEFLNGAVLAVTQNAVLHANRAEAPIFCCTLTEEHRGWQIETRTDGKLKVAELTFRTPDGANVGMKLSGLEYKEAPLIIKRPEKFVMPDDGVDPSANVELQTVTMAKLIGPKNYCSIFNLPDELTEPLVHDLLSQFGKLKSLKLLTEKETGKLKGYGFFEYNELDDTDLAITALNGFVCGQRVIAVRWMGQQKLPSQLALQAAPTCSQHPNSITQKIISNPMIASHVKQGLDVGVRPSLIVQLLNAVQRSELGDDVEYEDVLGQVHSEAAKYGKVAQVLIPRPAKDGSHTAGDGIGKIFVVFENLTAARKFQLDSNGRKFDDRTACAAFYPSEMFKEGKFNLPSAEPSSAGV